MRILGISAFYHDSAAALVDDGIVVAAAQEERFTRRKYDARYPRNAIAFCLAQAGIGLDKVDRVAFYDKPFLKFERLLETYVSFAPRGFASFRMALPLWLREKLFQKPLLVGELRRREQNFDWENKLVFFAPKGVKIPVVVSAFPEEICPVPRKWAEKAYPKLAYYKRHPKGAHFAAWEQPQAIVEDLRAGFRSLR